jgi:hypothetical protein
MIIVGRSPSGASSALPVHYDTGVAVLEEGRQRKEAWSNKKSYSLPDRKRKLLDGMIPATFKIGVRASVAF